MRILAGEKPFPLRKRKKAPAEIREKPESAAGTPVGDPVNHPPHYRLTSGMECIDVTEDMSFCRGNAVKYLWRAGLKGDEIEDLEKALWYIKREIARLRRQREEGEGND